MSRWRWAWVSLGLGIALPASCTLDLGPVLDPKDAGATDAAVDSNNPDVFVLPTGCVSPPGAVEALCNPFTNAGCPAALACDTTFNTQPRLACLPNDGLGMGEACSFNEGPYCAGKFTCSGSPGVCTNFCCADTECATGLCVPFDFTLGTLGFCEPPETDGGTDGGTDSGTD
jgi:hypothetical protein